MEFLWKRRYIRMKNAQFRFLKFYFTTILFALTCQEVITGQNLLSNPECTVYDQSHHRYLVSCYGDGSIVQIDSCGQQSYFRAPSGHLLSNTICGNTLYVSAIHSIKAFDLDSGTELWDLNIPGSYQLDGMSCDGAGHLYVADFHSAGNHDQIFKVDPASQTYSVFVPYGHGLCSSPQDIIFDPDSNRLIVACYYTAPIQAVSLADSTVSTVVIPPVNNFDGIARDNDGNYYLTSWTTKGVHRYTPGFTNPPETIITGLDGPANLSYNPVQNILAIPEFDGDSVVFLPVFPVGLKEKEQGKLEVFPNPVSGSVQIRLDSPETGDLLLTLSGMLGQNVYSSRCRKTEQSFSRTLDLSPLQPSLFLLEISLEGYIYKTLIVKI